MPSPRLVTDIIADWAIQLVAYVLTNGDYGNYENCAVIKKEGRSTIIFASKWFNVLSKDLNDQSTVRWLQKLQDLGETHETFIFQICDNARKHYIFAKASFQDKKVTIKDSLRGCRNENDPFYTKIFKFISSVIQCVYPTQAQHEWGR
jgi:hypothetical protein